MWVVPPETPLGFHMEDLKKDPLTYCSSWGRGRGTIVKACHLLHKQGLLLPGEETFTKVLGHCGEKESPPTHTSFSPSVSVKDREKRRKSTGNIWESVRTQRNSPRLRSHYKMTESLPLSSSYLLLCNGWLQETGLQEADYLRGSQRSPATTRDTWAKTLEGSGVSGTVSITVNIKHIQYLLKLT